MGATRRVGVPRDDVISRLDCTMAHIKGATARRKGDAAAAVVLPTVRVDPANLRRLQAARAARGCSLAALTDELLSRVVFDAAGQLIGLVPTPVTHQGQEEFDLKSA